jgi:hypothetical protein
MKNNLLRCGSLRILLMLCLFASTATLQANIIRGRVLDAETGEPLEGAQVHVNEAFVSTTFFTKVSTDSLGYFHYRCGDMGRLTFTAKYFGYHDGTEKTIGIEGNDTIRLKDIRLKPSQLLLKEVEVRAKQRRFYMRGDTVVFNPEAFNMEEGARLGELIEKLPGVSIKDGQLLWNGEPLKLMMNGQEAFSKDMLMKHLPVEAVESIKAYDRKSELAERTGVNDGKEEHVLDVSIKPSWMDKMYGEAMATGYSSGHYAASLDALRLSDTDPLLIFGRVSDEPAEVTMRTINSSGSRWGAEPVRQQMASVGYQHSWKKTGEELRHNYWNITASPNHTDRSKDSWENTQTFLPGTAPTESRTTRHDYQHALTVPLHSVSYLYLKKHTLRLEGEVKYEEGRKENHQHQTLSELTEGKLLTVNTSTYHASNRSKGITAKGEASLTRYINDGAVSTGINLNFSQQSNKGASEGNYHYYTLDPHHTLDLQNYDTDTHHLAATWHMELSKGVGSQLFTDINFSTTYSHDTHDEERQRDNTPDLANSLNSRTQTWGNSLSTRATLTLDAFSLSPSVALTHQYEHIDYQRGALDTMTQRNLLMINPSVGMRYKLGKQMNLQGSIGYTTTPAQLLDCIDYVDDTNPLYIRSGNSELKNSHSLCASIKYNMLLTQASQALSVSADYQKQHSPIAMMLHYNSQTGVYHATQQNVQGGNTWNIGIDYERSIGNHVTWRNKLSETWGRSYGILTMVDEATEVTYNRQSRSALSYTTEAECSLAAWTLNLSNRFGWTNYTYSDKSQQQQDIFRNETELNIRYHHPKWTFRLHPKLAIDRGHIAQTMNTSQFLLNASATYKFLHNKAELTLEGKDLLNQVKRHTYSITPTTHTESGEDYLHRYVMLSFKYKFEPKKKD